MRSAMLREEHVGTCNLARSGKHIHMNNAFALTLSKSEKSGGIRTKRKPEHGASVAAATTLWKNRARSE
eukprot:5924995-Pyramimonas_sp.AAC.1